MLKVSSPYQILRINAIIRLQSKDIHIELCRLSFCRNLVNDDVRGTFVQSDAVSMMVETRVLDILCTMEGKVLEISRHRPAKGHLMITDESEGGHYRQKFNEKHQESPEMTPVSTSLEIP